VQVADGALYWAKRSGRNRSRRYDPEHVMVVTDAQRTEFSAMLEQPEAVRPVFQPIVALATGRIVGYEALARFANQRGRLPTWWFAQAHKFGLGHQLEAEAVRVATATKGRPADAWLAVNLSPSAVVSRELSEILDGDLNGLVIEVTEQERIGDDERTRDVLNNLRARGARIAVDDTGAGYAGLQTVMSLRADIIKLDRSLVADVDRDRAKRALVEAFVSFARNTGAEVCAEGIENLQALDVLREIGVTYGQGYAIARPGPAWPSLDPQAIATCWPHLAGGRRLTAVRDDHPRAARGDGA
jgi:EAL domain-containing protein (putative c-di-GMP-specific phosphodiesterase class I)